MVGVINVRRCQAGFVATCSARSVSTAFESGSRGWQRYSGPHVNPIHRLEQHRRGNSAKANRGSFHNRTSHRAEKQSHRHVEERPGRAGERGGAREGERGVPYRTPETGW